MSLTAAHGEINKIINYIDDGVEMKNMINFALDTTVRQCQLENVCTDVRCCDYRNNPTLTNVSTQFLYLGCWWWWTPPPLPLLVSTVYHFYSVHHHHYTHMCLFIFLPCFSLASSSWTSTTSLTEILCNRAHHTTPKWSELNINKSAVYFNCCTQHFTIKVVRGINLDWIMTWGWERGEWMRRWIAWVWELQWKQQDYWQWHLLLSYRTSGGRKNGVIGCYVMSA